MSTVRPLKNIADDLGITPRQFGAVTAAVGFGIVALIIMLMA